MRKACLIIAMLGGLFEDHTGKCVMVFGSALGAVLIGFIWLLILHVRLRSQARIIRQKLAEEAAQKETAQAASKGKSEFLANITHEIRTPMNAIMGFTDLALKTNLNSELREYLDTVRTSADWLMHVVSDSLDFSRIEAGGLELDRTEFSFSECLSSAMKLVAAEAASKNLKTTLKVEPRVPERLYGDPARLRQIVVNLLENAVKFTASGSVMLLAKVEAEDPGTVTIQTSVADTGMGIPADKRQSIFEPFKQADPSVFGKFGGTGLGLAICSKLVQAMRGSIDVQSQLGAGSLFRFTVRFDKAPHSSKENQLPKQEPAKGERKECEPNNDEAKNETGDEPKDELKAQLTTDEPKKDEVKPPEPKEVEPKQVESKSVASKKDERSNASGGAKPISILVAEDNVINQRLVMKLLQFGGHRVTCASDGKQTVDLFAKEHFDLILMDLQMPVMDGFEATAIIRASEPEDCHVPIYALTACASPGDREKCLAADMDGYLSKPIQVNELLQILTKVSAGRANVSHGSLVS